MGTVGLGSPVVSIVTPSFNQGRFLGDAIDSVLDQDYPEIEYLVVDAASTDETIDLLRSYGERVRWISERDGGQADGIDKGIRRTNGDIVTWLNSDDRYLPGAVSSAVAALSADPTIAGVYGDAELVDPDGHLIGRYSQIEPFDLGRLVNVLDYIVQPATFFRRSAYESAGGLDRTLNYCLDYDLWIRMGRAAPLRYLARPLAQVRIHPETKTASGGMPRLMEIERMIQRHGRPILPDSFQRDMLLATVGSGVAAVRAHRWHEIPSLAATVVRYAPRMAARRLSRAVSRAR
jgi:hypothetical protein